MPIATIAALILVSFWVGRLSMSSRDSADSEHPTSSQRTRQSSIRVNQSSPDMEHLIRDRKIEANPQEQGKMFFQMLSSLTPENAPILADAMFADGFSSANSGHEFALLLYTWGVIAGEDALEYILSHDILKHTEPFVANILEGWTSTDRASLAAKALSLNDPSGRALLQKFVAENLLREAVFDEAADWVNQIDSNLQQEFTKELVGIKLKEGLKEGLDWAMSVKSAAMKEVALERAAAKYIEDDFSGAVDWASNLSATKDHQQAVARVAEEWAEKDPAASAAWVAGLPDGEPRNYSVGKVIREWSRRDFVKAGEWLNTLENDHFRDQGVIQYVHSVFDREPAVSLEWALSISDENLQKQFSAEAYKAWMKRDHEGATKWAEASGRDWNRSSKSD